MRRQIGKDGAAMTLRSALLVLASLAAAGCGAVLDRSEFKPLTPVEIAEIKAKADAEKNAEEGQKKPDAASAAPQEETAKPDATDAPAASVVAAVAPEEKPRASGLFASLFGGDEPSAAEPASAGPDATPAASQTAAKPDEDPPTAADVAAAKAEAEADLAAIPVEEAAEVSEAELTGEDEADPAKIAVPKPPVDDGLEHDFVNVYTARPERPQELFEGLPGVAWQGNLVLASRGPDGDPRGLFDGEVQPYAHYVPGLPRDVVQAANGLLLAHSAINVSCVKSPLLGMIRDAERHFSRKAVITSGYRSPSHNRSVRGALHSQHLYCNAVDLYMPGIARDELARYFYSHPSRGGLGLYCHTKSIHVDTGRRREWRWACRKRG
ncbi:putative Peptidase M15A [uncultured Pleomorphomonas sp.]|uniref:Murein endopeptidase K n=1 Tax=uncultured Pleomorphomonas sp. TaxID=442121 RepID=A0A212LAG5_9HYPH|nr:D-Ala-D-Ala carboxypeptidase family metallohydrolase [uncultured Pleomorphomonas sp.]SCM74525.1 putative Peptidase M15A [uncultured Pleomorphomonas sp.]